MWLAAIYQRLPQALGYRVPRQVFEENPPAHQLGAEKTLVRTHD